LSVSVFDDVHGKTIRHRTRTLRDLKANIDAKVAKSKDALPLIKLGKFGDVKTGKGTLRHDGNLLAFTGIEGDYDGKGFPLSVEKAVELLTRHAVAALVYTTPSHHPDKPRFRILCPASRDLTAAERERSLARLHGLMLGALDPSCFDRSRTYYVGRVEGVPYESHLVEGRFIDLAEDLDFGAMGRDGDFYEPETVKAKPERPAEDFELAPPPPPRDVIESALAALPDEACESRETWLHVGMALHDAYQGGKEGFTLWDEWSQGAANYGGTREAWRSFSPKPGGVGIGTLFRMAKEAGWTDPRSKPKTPEPGRLAFLTPAQCETTPPAPYVVKGLAAAGQVGCIFGAPGAGKSLIAPHIGYAVARGERAFGLRTKPGPVFYVAAEDQNGMAQRVRALREAHGDAPDFLLVQGVSDLLSDGSGDLAALQAEAERRRPALIVIDTLAMAFPGLEENSAEGMGRVVSVARSLAQWGAAVILVHHDTKADGGTPRGHSVLNGALDFALHVKRDPESGIVRATLTKNRNGPCTLDLAFRIGTSTLGDDVDGDAITAALADELVAGSAPRRGRSSPGETRAIELLKSLAASTEQAITLTRWRDAYMEQRVSTAESLDGRQKAFRRAVEGLREKGWIRLQDENVMLAGQDHGWSAADIDGVFESHVRGTA
jgi:hypothetical protein